LVAMVRTNVRSNVLESVITNRSWHIGLLEGHGTMAECTVIKTVGATGQVSARGTHQHVHPPVKHTFIHFDDEHVDDRRCSSVPPNCRYRCHGAPSHNEEAHIAAEEPIEKASSDPGPERKRKPRPPKKRRNQHHKFSKAITEEIKTNPKEFDLESLRDRMPISWHSNERLLRKFMCRMETTLQQEREQHRFCEQ